MPGQNQLHAGDIIEIKYRLARFGPSGEDVGVRWICAEVIDSEPGSRPLAVLVDGQLTELREFMEWRLISRAALRSGWQAA